MNGGEFGNKKNENFKVEIIFNMKRQYNHYNSTFVCMNHYFHRLLIFSQHMQIRRLFIN